MKTNKAKRRKVCIAWIEKMESKHGKSLSPTVKSLMISTFEAGYLHAVLESQKQEGKVACM